jgi:Mn-dependent DtxR family transcriptional regulator
MQQQGLVVARGQEFELTAEGERVARQVVRAHRLLERYFADEARLPLGAVHAEAERREHSLTADQVEALSASLGHPRLDPHGDPIPGRDGEIAPPRDTPGRSNSSDASPTSKTSRRSHTRKSWRKDCASDRSCASSSPRRNESR